MKIARSVSLIAAAAIILILTLLILSKSGYLFRKTPGSFEYIRKGEDFLENGNYPAAIRLFEKAHESSPDNKAIRDNLVYAYARYASELAGAGKHDDAVKAMIMAYEVVQNTYTMQGLSTTFAGKAMAELKGQEWAKAMDSLNNARSAAEDSDMAGKNLSIILHNYAVKEDNAGRDRAAILLLKQAALAHQDVHIYKVLGDIYYKNSDFENARFYFEKARSLDPNDKDIPGRLAKVAREIELSQGRSGRALPHFDIQYEKELPIDSALVAGLLEKAYADVGTDLGYFPGSKTVVSFYSVKNFREVFNMPDIVRALYDGNMRIPFPETALDRQHLASYLYHEYTHAVISAKTNNNCPPWLSEGIAVWEEVRWTRPGAKIEFAADVMNGTLVSIQSLESAFKGVVPEKKDAEFYYLLAYTAIDYMADTWGLAGVRSVLARIAEGRHAVNAIDDEFMVTEKNFNMKWAEFVRKKFIKEGT